MNSKSVEEIANAVLYEGYMLYPYRASSVKNRVRWNFGVLYPRAYSDAQGGIDAWMSQTECLIRRGAETRVRVNVRFLQGIDRAIGELSSPFSFPFAAQPQFRPVRELRVGERVFQSWQEATERDVFAGPLSVSELEQTVVQRPFELPARTEYEAILSADGQIAGLITRTREQISGTLEITASCLRDEVCKLTLRVSNGTETSDGGKLSRDDAVRRSLLSAHSILRVEEGEFISLLDPPEDLRDFASACSNIGTWPVLAGDEGRRDTVLSSPIILYDYPQIAPESAGDLYDGTEIDEILALRILTLTDDEKRQMREGDEHARKILERTEALPPEEFAKMHGALRGLRTVREGGQ